MDVSTSFHFTNVPVDQAPSSLPWISLPASQVISLPPVFILIFFSAEFSSWRKMWSHHSLFKTSDCFLFISVKKQTNKKQPAFFTWSAGLLLNCWSLLHSLFISFKKIFYDLYQATAFPQLPTTAFSMFYIPPS